MQLLEIPEIYGRAGGECAAYAFRLVPTLAGFEDCDVLVIAVRSSDSLEASICDSSIPLVRKPLSCWSHRRLRVASSRATRDESCAKSFRSLSHSACMGLACARGAAQSPNSPAAVRVTIVPLLQVPVVSKMAPSLPLEVMAHEHFHRQARSAPPLLVAASPPRLAQ